MMNLFSRVDWRIFLPALFLSILGSLVLSSVAPNSFPKQFIYLALALFAFLLFSKIDLKVLRSFAPWFYAGSIVLLVATILFGAVTRGAARWIVIGPFNLQPSEITKPFLLIFFAWLVSGTSGPKKFLVTTLFALLAFFLILNQPDLGSGLVIMAGFLGVIFMGRIPVVYLFLGLIFVAFFSPIGWHFLADYQRQRVISFLSPESDPLGSGYNALQAVIAVGSGMLTGRGLGGGTQSQLAFLPERQTDFIFSALAEELGFLGAGMLLLAFVLLFWRIIMILKNTEDIFSRAFLGGAFLVLFSQTFVNIGMNLGILPITGIPLPFVSAGGSSLVSMSTLLGMISSISSDLAKRDSLGIIHG
ncbi:MAG: FtsW/RodA/SpoVE family cell cycle protein [bacterium]|nr:FtsW/RodA/SpoVE family cell cycle protein [bacterium]